MELDLLPLETKIDRRFDMLEEIVDELHDHFEEFEDRMSKALDRLEAIIGVQAAKR